MATTLNASNSGSGGLVQTADASGILALQTAGTTAVTIDTSQNVGIGTTSPSNYGKLAVAGTIAAGTDQTDQVSLLGGGGTSRVEATGGNASVNLSLAVKGGGSFYIWRGGYGGTNTLLIDGSSNLKFNSGYGSVATAYGCRAWVMFNGSNGSIFAQGNVSSITRNGTGNYRVNFSTAMPDASFSVVASCSGQGSVNGSTNAMLVNASAGGTNVTPTTTTTNLFCYHPGNQVAQDTTFVTVAVFR